MYRYRTTTSVFAVLVLMLGAGVALGFQRMPVPEGTRLVLKLDSGISSKASRVGDRFTATVITPPSYAGATVQGFISKLEESGRLSGKTEMLLEFETIELRDGRIAPLQAELMEVRGSDSVKIVDEEGNVESGSRGRQAIKRGAIGAAVGGVLGGLIGGGRGAVVGILVGGGAGAGSLVIDGEKELRLESGSELEIRALRSPAGSTVEEEAPAALRVTTGLIMDVQDALNQLGYEAGTVDGKMGPRTRSALIRFQRDHGLPRTGRVDAATVDKLGVRR